MPTALDASVGGLGGCPFAPKATGNVATEDLAYLLEGEGVETGVDLEALIGISEWLEELLGRRGLPVPRRPVQITALTSSKIAASAARLRNSARNPTSTSFELLGRVVREPARSPRGPAHGHCARFRRPGHPRARGRRRLERREGLRLVGQRELEDPLVLDVFQIGLAEIADGGALGMLFPTSTRVVSESRICPPWPAEQMRAARTTSIPR